MEEKRVNRWEKKSERSQRRKMVSNDFLENNLKRELPTEISDSGENMIELVKKDLLKKSSKNTPCIGRGGGWEVDTFCTYDHDRKWIKSTKNAWKR